MKNVFYFGEAYRRQICEDVMPMDLMRKVAGLILNEDFRMGDRMRAVNFGDTRAGSAGGTYLARRLQHSGLQGFLHDCQNNFKEAFGYRSADSPAFSFLWYDPALKPEEPKGAVPVKVLSRHGHGGDAQRLGTRRHNARLQMRGHGGS